MDTILLIENDPTNLLALALTMRSFGYTVLEASDRGEVWSYSRDHSGTIRLIMMETSLNHDSAYEFFTRLQLVHPEIRALLLTDASSARMAEKFAMPCECSFLQRPFRAATLADAIRGLLDGPRTRAVTSAC